MRPFTDILRELGAGETLDDLTARLAEVVEAVMDTRKSGAITISLTIKPNGDSGVIVAESIKSKVPEKARGDTVFFATSGGSLVRQDPRQKDLPLHSVPGTKPSEVA